MLKRLVYIGMSFFSLILSAQSTFQLTIEMNDTTSPFFTGKSITESINGDIYTVSSINPGGWYSKNRLTKLDANGNVQWDTVYSHTPEHEYFPDVMPVQDGGIILACTSYSYPIHDLDTISDILVWKINSDGVIEWQNIYGARDFYDIYATDDGGFLLLGSIHEEAYYHGLDMIVYKIDSKGNIIWKKQLGQQGKYPYEEEYPNSIKQIGDNIYVCGLHKTQGVSQYNDGIMYTLDSEGNLIWDIFLASNLSENQIRINSTFKFNGSLFFNATNSLFEFNPISGDYWEVPDSINWNTLGIFNNGYNFGRSCGENDKEMKVINYSNGSYELLKYNNLSNSYYQKAISVMNSELVECIYTRDNGILTLTSGGNKINVVKTDCLGNVGSWNDECNPKILEKAQIGIFPNPSADQIQIDATFDFNQTVIYSLNGQLITFENLCYCPRQTIDISNLTEGVYFVRISSEEHYALSRFVKI